MSEKTEEGIPDEVIEDLELKIEDKIEFNSKIIVEKHQASIKIPTALRSELDLPIGSIPCKITLNEDKSISVVVNK